MKILLAGATGFVGQVVIKKLLQKNATLIVLTRNPQKYQNREPYTQCILRQWNAPYGPLDPELLQGVDGVINLMGENISNARWTTAQKEKIYDSRIEGTQKLVQALTSQQKFMINASAIGIYHKNLSSEIDEKGSFARDFLAHVCRDWERQLAEVPTTIRTSVFRIGVVLGRGGGLMKKLTPLFKLGLGGPIASGDQAMSWIHVEDLAEMICTAAVDANISGTYNAVATYCSNKEFTRAFAHAVKRPALFPAPALALKTMMGEMSTIALDGQKVINKRWDFQKYPLRYPKIQEAMREIFTKKS